jgi:glutamine amidotransferase
MCELLGLSFSTPVSASMSLNMFQTRGAANPDGWGIAFYREGYLQIIKESKPAVDSHLFDFIENYPQSEIFISHVRRSTVGNRSYVNTHPFYQSIRLGNEQFEMAFAHNGTLSKAKDLKLSRFMPIGQTDSERAFCNLLEAIATRGISQWNKQSYELVESHLQTLNDTQNTLNCIFSDGIRLFCYSDENRHNDGLRYMKWRYPFGKMPLVKDETQLGTIDIQSQNIGDSPREREAGYVIVTKALSEGNWTDFKPGRLMVFENDEIVYS